MSTTRHPGFPTVAARFADEYLRTAATYAGYLATFSLLAVVVSLLTVPGLLVFVAASVCSYALHLAAFEFRDAPNASRTTLADVLAGDSLTGSVALVVGLFVGYSAVYLASLATAVLLVEFTGSGYVGILAAMYLPVVDFLGNRTRWYLSVQAVATVIYLAVVRGLGIRAHRGSMERLFPGYRFAGRRPTRTSTTPRR